MNDIILQKRHLRTEARKRRNDFVAERTTPWCLTEDKSVHCFDRGVSLASYRPVGSEADPSPIETLARKSMMCVSYPRIDVDGLMRFYRLGPSGAMATNSVSIEEPGDDAYLDDPAIILVPLIAFDRSGTRLGQGGGHYDRALASAAASVAKQGSRLLKIGIAWSVQEMEDLPREPWDIPLDIVITEREWILTS